MNTENNGKVKRLAGMYCLVKQCKNNSGNFAGFFRCPKDVKRAKKWAIACGREDLVNSGAVLNNRRVCAAHFTPEMFVSGAPTKRLIRNAFPTIFLVKDTVQEANEDIEMVALYCSVNGCCESNENRYRFPNPAKHTDLFKKWVKLCGQKSLLKMSPEEVFNNCKVCSIHFVETDFVADNKLSCEAYPTKFLPEFNAENNLETSRLDNYNSKEFTRIIYSPFEIIQGELEELEELEEVHTCRTCLNTVFSKDSTVFTSRQTEMLSRCVPQIEISNSDRICRECSKNLEISYQFITQCQKVENKLKCDKGKQLNDTQNDPVKSNTILHIEKIPSTEQDNNCNFKVTTNSKEFLLKGHFNVIITMPEEEDTPWSETHIKLSSLQNELGNDAKNIFLNDDNISKEKNQKLVKTRKNNCRKYILKYTIYHQHQSANKNEFRNHKYKCGINLVCCGQKFKSNNTYLMHRSLHNQKNEKFSCDICGKSFISFSGLFLHKEIHTAPVICPICKKKLKNKMIYRGHIKFVHRAPRNLYLKHRCNRCDEKFSRGDYLRQHKEKHTQEDIQHQWSSIINTFFN